MTIHVGKSVTSHEVSNSDSFEERKWGEEKKSKNYVKRWEWIGESLVIIMEFRIERFRIGKQRNIPVLGDAERIVAASFTDIDLNMNMSLGSIDSIESQRQIVTIMEGGQEAFKRRNEIYSSWGK